MNEVKGMIGDDQGLDFLGIGTQDISPDWEL